MKRYAIGDIQGCYDELRALLREIRFDERRDQLWLTGDLVNRGPGSLETLRYLYFIRRSLRVTLGNHDFLLLAAASGGAELSKSDTLDDTLSAPDASKLCQWLGRWPLLHASGGYVMVHAGIPPQWSLAQASRRARAVETALNGPRRAPLLRALFGQPPSADPFWAEAKQTVDGLTRMRRCAADGTLTPESSTAAGSMPWYAHPERKTRGARFIIGHWAALAGDSGHPEVLALDTGCVWGKRLTAMRLGDERRFAVPCPDRMHAAAPYFINTARPAAPSQLG